MMIIHNHFASWENCRRPCAVFAALKGVVVFSDKFARRESPHASYEMEDPLKVETFSNTYSFLLIPVSVLCFVSV